jgi:hypothetical protein
VVEQRPEGALIERAMATRTPKLSARKAARLAQISEARWRQIVSGYQTVSQGVRVPVVAPAKTIARMAKVAGVSSRQLADAGRQDAAELLDSEAADGDQQPSIEDLIEASRELRREDKDALLATLRALRSARAERPNGTRASGS